MAAEKLRDLSQPIDVGLLDATVAAFYGTGSKEEVRPYSLGLSTLYAFCEHTNLGSCYFLFLNTGSMLFLIDATCSERTVLLL